MFMIIRRKRMFSVGAAVAAAVVLCCGCSDYGVGEAFVVARNGGNNECGKDGTAGSCKKVTIGGQTWMAENLNYKPSSGNSWCPDNKESYCNIYGRLYDWATAMNIDTKYNSNKWDGSDVKHRGVCPKGWYLPSRAEWDTLVAYAGGDSNAGKKLKSTYGWYKGAGLYGTDDFGFSALPGGGRYSINHSDDVYGAGYDGHWWTATEYDGSRAYYQNMDYSSDGVDESYYDWGRADESYYGTGKSYGYSVRCVKD